MKFPCILSICFVIVLNVNAVTWPDPKNFRLTDYINYSPRTNVASNAVNNWKPKSFRQNSNPGEQSTQNNCLTDTQKRITKGINRLAVGLDYMLSKSNPNGNILVAPINVFKTLATVMLGTAGDTEKELLKMLSGLILGRKITEGTEAFHKEMGKLLAKVTDIDPGVKFGTNINIAGGVFVQKGFQIKQRFIEMAKSIYRSDVTELDFLNDGTNSAIAVNNWVANHTENRIKELIQPPIDPTTKLIVAGALYFNGDWEFPFFLKATKWQPFYLGDGKDETNTVQVQMMVGQALIPYYEDKEVGYQAIGLPYKNRSVYMYVVLPRQNTSLKQLTTRFMHNDFTNIVEKSKPSEVFYVMPKMQLENKINLRSPLEYLGVRSLFNPSKANFTNIADAQIYASEILHKVEMDVNEIGTTASAATATTVNRGGYINFRADRPFFLFIYNVKAEVMTFWASIQKPTPFQ
ncbi:leukocyte elastase inhibitor-like [Planococcus citri]|uniref:leukocyte elastase inhibitor-like n=1 Tax=Planococcus citri TaxID=170843 RepID=UPI0031F90DEA